MSVEVFSVGFQRNFNDLVTAYYYVRVSLTFLSIEIKQKYNFKKLYVTFVGKVGMMNPTHWPEAMFCKDCNEYIISLIKVI